MRSASSSITTTMNGSSSRFSGLSGVRENGCFRGCFFSIALADLVVVAREVAHRDGRHELVAAVHLDHAPVQRRGRLAHVGDHGGQEVRDALVDGKLEHLRIDHDQAHVGGRGLVDERQDHRVDRHRLARAGGARHEEVRHAREVGDDGLAGDVLAHGHGEVRMHVGIGLRADDLREAHDLALGIGDLESHAGGAGDRLDHADRGHRERAGEVAREVHHLRALDPDGRLHLVARDDRAGVGRHHLHLHVEVEELPLDQARGVLERFLRRALDMAVRRVEDRDRRQRRVRQVGEERHLLFLRHPLALRDDHLRDLDADRLVLLEDLLRHLDLDLALLRRRLAGLAVAPRLDARAHGAGRPLDRGAEPFREAYPRQAGEDAERRGERGDEDQRRAGEAETRGRRPRQERADRASAPGRAAPAFRLCRRSASRALLAASSRTKPARETASERRSRSSHSSTRRYSRRMPQAASTTHHQAE